MPTLGFLVVDDLKKGYYLLFIDGGKSPSESSDCERLAGRTRHMNRGPGRPRGLGSVGRTPPDRAEEWPMRSFGAA